MFYRLVINNMIINTGQRTDIPAFYSEWFANRIKEGYVMVRNPYFPQLVTRFLLDPKVVDIIGFCTKNPKPMLKYLDILKPYGQIWFVTITAYDNDIEPNVPPIDDVIESFIKLSKYLGKDKVIWRYTPIIINDKYSVLKHIETFKYILERIKDYTSYVVYGFLDLYDKIKNNTSFVDGSDEDKIRITREFKKLCDKYNLSLRLCSKEKWLKEYGVDINGCIRLEDYEKALGKYLIIKDKMEARKNYCSCYLSNDIGAYNSCLHLCKYCYANGMVDTIKRNNKMHDKKSPFLIGNRKNDDIVKVAEQVSFIDETPRLF